MILKLHLHVPTSPLSNIPHVAPNASIVLNGRISTFFSALCDIRRFSRDSHASGIFSPMYFCSRVCWM